MLSEQSHGRGRPQRRTDARGTGWAFQLSTAALILGIGVAVTAGLFILFSLSGSLLWFIPWNLRVIVGFVLIILALLGAGLLAAQTPLPGRWLLLVAAGVLLLLSPLLMLWLNGSWDAPYGIPSRSGGQVTITVRVYAWIACTSGLGSVVLGAAGWIAGRLRGHRGGEKTRRPGTRPAGPTEEDDHR